MKLISRFLITALSLLAVAWLLPGVEIENFYIALLIALIFGVINLTLRPVLLLLTFPINLITLGLFTLIVNGFLFWLVARFINGFSVDGFFVAILGALIISVFKWLGDRFLKD